MAWQRHIRSRDKYISSVCTRISFSITTTWNTWRRYRSVVQVRPDSKTKTIILTTLETRRLRGDLIEVLKILNGYEDINSNFVFKLKEDSMTRGHKAALLKPYCRLDKIKFSFYQRTINDWNNLSYDCVNATSVSMAKNIIDNTSSSSFHCSSAVIATYARG